MIPPGGRPASAPIVEIKTEPGPRGPSPVKKETKMSSDDEDVISCKGFKSRPQPFTNGNKESFAKWLTEYTFLYRHRKTNNGESDMKADLPLYMRGDAAEMFTFNIEAQYPNLTWKEAQEKLLKLFDTVPNRGVLGKLMHRKMEENESAATYINEQRRNAASANLPEESVVDMIIEGFPEFLKTMVRSEGPTTFDELRESAMRQEMVVKQLKKAGPELSGKDSLDLVSFKADMLTSMSELLEKQKSVEPVNAISNGAPQAVGVWRPPHRADGRAYHPNAWKNQEGNQERQTNNYGQQQPAFDHSNKECFNCHQYGHIKRNCPNRQPQNYQNFSERGRGRGGYRGRGGNSRGGSYNNYNNQRGGYNQPRYNNYQAYGHGPQPIYQNNNGNNNGYYQPQQQQGNANQSGSNQRALTWINNTPNNNGPNSNGNVVANAPVNHVMTDEESYDSQIELVMLDIGLPAFVSNEKPASGVFQCGEFEEDVIDIPEELQEARIEAEVDGLWATILMDSGAKVNLINVQYFPKLKINENETRRMRHVNNDVFYSMGTAIANVTIEIDGVSRTKAIKFNVTKNLPYPALLGTQGLGQFRIGMACTESAVKFSFLPESDYATEFVNSVVDDEEFDLPQTSAIGGGKKFILACQGVFLPSMHQIALPVMAPELRHVRQSDVIVTPNEFDAHGKANTLPGVYTLLYGNVYMVVNNLSRSDVLIKPGDIICSYENGKMFADAPTNFVASETEYQASEIKFKDAVKTIQIGKQLDDDQKERLIKLLQEKRVAFSINPDEIGRHKTFVHSFEMIDPEPVHIPQYAMHPEVIKQLQAKLERMEKQQLLELSRSPYNSPVLAVRKKDGTFRIVIDFRRVNLKTKNQTWPLPKIGQALNFIAGNQLYSLLDFNDGFSQLPLHPSCREVTAFSVGDRHLQYLVSPQGNRTSMAAFCTMMNHSFGDLQYRYLLYYADDVIITSCSFDEMLERINIFLERCIDAGLTIKLEKCIWCVTKIAALGHIISRDGLQTDPEKVSTITQMRAPENVQEVQTLLGAAGFYRMYCQGYASMVEPLTRLTRSGVKFQFGEEQMKAFDRLKKALTNSPILTHFDPEKPHAVYSDACKTGIGGLLVQKEDDKWKPVIYVSRSLTDAEKAYSTTDLECLAAVYCIRMLKHYLAWGRFTLFTDHSALTTLMTKKELGNARLTRYALQLSDFEFDIVHKPGRHNQIADWLSRMSRLSTKCVINDEKVFCDTDLVAAVSEDFTLEMIKKEQAGHPLIAKIRHERDVLGKRSMFVEKDNVLSKISHGGARPCLAAVLPTRRLQRRALELAHDATTSGHQGAVRTLARVIRFAYWPGLTKDVYEYVQSCTKCMARKRPIGKSDGLMQPIEVGGVFDLIQIDHAGAFTPSPEGYKHYLIAMDVFSRFVIGRAVKSTSAEETMRFFLNEICMVFGIPKRVHSDRGTCFTAHMTAQTYDIIGVESSLSTRERPQSNAYIERCNRTFADIIAMYINSNHTNWPEALKFAIYSHNTSRHATTHVSPYEMMFGRVPRIVGNPMEQYSLGMTNPEEWVDLLKSWMAVMQETSRRNVQRAQASSKLRFDDNRRDHNYQEGDLVLVFFPRVKKGLTPKFRQPWLGPMRVIRRVGTVDYEILDVKRKKKFVIHVSKMKPYYQRLGSSDESDHSSDEEIMDFGGEDEEELLDIPENQENVQDENQDDDTRESATESTSETGDEIVTPIQRPVLHNYPTRAAKRTANLIESCSGHKVTQPQETAINNDDDSMPSLEEFDATDTTIENESENDDADSTLTNIGSEVDAVSLHPATPSAPSPSISTASQQEQGQIVEEDQFAAIENEARQNANAPRGHRSGNSFSNPRLAAFLPSLFTMICLLTSVHCHMDEITNDPEFVIFNLMAAFVVIAIIILIAYCCFQKRRLHIKAQLKTERRRRQNAIRERVLFNYNYPEPEVTILRTEPNTEYSEELIASAPVMEESPTQPKRPKGKPKMTVGGHHCSTFSFGLIAIFMISESLAISPLLNHSYVAVAGVHGLRLKKFGVAQIWAGSWEQLIHLQISPVISLNLAWNPKFYTCSEVQDTDANILCNQFNSMTNTMFKTASEYRQKYIDKLEDILRAEPGRENFDWIPKDDIPKPVFGPQNEKRHRRKGKGRRVKRSQQSLIPLIGDALQILFGVSTMRNVDSLEDKFSRMEQSIMSSKNETSLIKEDLLGLSRIVDRRAQNVSAALRLLGQHVTAIEENSDRLLHAWSNETNLQRSFRALQTTIDDSYLGSISSIYNLTLLANEIETFQANLNLMRSGFLPPTLINYGDLKKILDRINTEVKPLFDLGIDEKDANLYYLLPLLRFTMVNDGILIRLSIPLKRHGSVSTHLILNPITSVIPCSSSACQWATQVPINETYLQLVTNGRSYLTNMEADEFRGEVELSQLTCISLATSSLCFTFELAQMRTPTLCSQAIFEWNKEDILRHCRFQLSLNRNYEVLKLGEDLLAVHRSAIPKYTIICYGKRQGSNEFHIKSWAELVILRQNCVFTANIEGKGKIVVPGPLSIHDSRLDSNANQGSPSFLFENAILTTHLNQIPEDVIDKMAETKQPLPQINLSSLELDPRFQAAITAELYHTTRMLKHKFNHVEKREIHRSYRLTFLGVSNAISKALNGVAIVYFSIILLRYGFFGNLVGPIFICERATAEEVSIGMRYVDSILDDPSSAIVSVTLLILWLVVMFLIINRGWFRKVYISTHLGTINSGLLSDDLGKLYISFIHQRNKLEYGRRREILLKIPMDKGDEIILAEKPLVLGSVRVWIIELKDTKLFFTLPSPIQILGMSRHTGTRVVIEEHVSIALSDIVWEASSPCDDFLEGSGGECSVQVVYYPIPKESDFEIRCLQSSSGYAPKPDKRTAPKEQLTLEPEIPSKTT